MNFTAYVYLLYHVNGQMHVYLIASSIKIIKKRNVFLCINSSQPGWFHVKTYMHVSAVICHVSAVICQYRCC